MKNKFLPTRWEVGNGFVRPRIIDIFPKKNRLKFQLLLLGLVAWIVLSKDISMQFNLSTDSRTLIDFALEHQALPTANDKPTATPATVDVPMPVNVSLLATEDTPQPTAVDEDIGNAFTNTTYTGNLDRERKRRKQMDYVKRFAKVARAEMKQYGIPASITMAQALIESDCGESRLARENHNHFGIKCFSKKCKKGHCSNFTDDSHKDFFRKYQSAWESYRAHSQLLQKGRYKGLYKLSKSDYKGWARGLKKAGYATDKRYADKLIALIENLQLYRLDNV